MVSAHVGKYKKMTHGHRIWPSHRLLPNRTGGSRIVRVVDACKKCQAFLDIRAMEGGLAMSSSPPWQLKDRNLGHPSWMVARPRERRDRYYESLPRLLLELAEHSSVLPPRPSSRCPTKPHFRSKDRIGNRCSRGRSSRDKLSSSYANTPGDAVSDKYTALVAETYEDNTPAITFKHRSESCMIVGKRVNKLYAVKTRVWVVARVQALIKYEVTNVTLFTLSWKKSISGENCHTLYTYAEVQRSSKASRMPLVLARWSCANCAESRVGGFIWPLPSHHG